MNVLKLVALITLVLALCFILAVISGVSIINLKEERRLANCTWMPVANVVLRDIHLAIPALKLTSLYLSGHPDTIGGPGIVSAVSDKPWDDEPLGFCDTELAGPPDVYRVSFRRAALSSLATEVGFSLDNGPKMIILNRRPMLHMNIEVTEGPVDVFVLDPGVNTHDGTYEPNRLRTAGWINGTHAVFSTCPRVTTGDFVSPCSYRVLRRADYIEVKFIGIHPEEYPVVGQTNTELVANLLVKFDAIVDHYTVPETLSD